jgi:excisionase family DNA binding protein
VTDALTDALRPIVAALVAEELARQAQVGDAPGRLLSINDAAAALGIGRSRLYAEMASGRLRSVKAGRRRLVPASALAEFAEWQAP